jgi:hypothetical protein
MIDSVRNIIELAQGFRKASTAEDIPACTKVMDDLVETRESL